MGYIYLVTNKINGKQYVGKTKYDINTRWIQHRSEAKRLKPDVYFVRALHKYGPENFIVQEIEECADDLLLEREKYYIQQYNTYNNGYNSTLGGEGNHKYENNEVLRLWNDGFLINEIANILKSHPSTISLILHSNGISKDYIRSRAQIKIGNTRKKQILQYSLNGELLNKFSCIAEAVQFSGLHETSIRGCCNHRLPTAGGFIWCHENEPKSIQQLIAELPTAKTKRPITQYTLQGEFIKDYNSIEDAATALNIHRSSIESALNNNNYHCMNYLWKYKDEDIDIALKVERYNHRKDYNKRAINQFDLQGNFIQTFDSAASAAAAIGKPGNGSSITKACKGKIKTAYKYKWAYVES